ncbi:MAG: hypothetical protein PPP58_02410 [Natronomonas sp.]
MSTQLNDDGIQELCETCGRKTPHDVSIELLTESTKEENAEFSREPYRVASCRLCGTEETLRMNNA